QYLQNGLEEADIVLLTPDEEIGSGKIYLVQSLIPMPTIPELKAAGSNYPQWVQDYYLDLPDDLSERVRQLAFEIAAPYDNPYDRAVAITEYLRKNIEYQAKVPALPAGRDPIEWFLFDLKKGFCNYYATAEILMLRAVGVPARLAVGYAEGTQEGEKTFAVRERDSHAWPEVFFPGIGWVEFEPTVSQAETTFNVEPPAVLANENQNNGNDLRNIPLPITDNDPFNRAEEEEARLDRLLQEEANRQKLISWLIVAGAVVLAATFILWIRSRAKVRRQMAIFMQRVEKNLEKRGIKLPTWLRNSIWGRKVSPMDRAFGVVTWALLQLRMPYYPGMTAARQVDVLKKRLPNGETALETLLVEYEKAMYTDEQADIQTARRASRQVRWLTARAWVNRLIHGPAQEEYEKILHRGNL
ncbi:MAG: transglutaminase domain-containing protein, partial [Anaerolineaceae bacterium]|nr:transglutaminase domain-containing protein [Anaerolineaceae bacterium]